MKESLFLSHRPASLFPSIAKSFWKVQYLPFNRVAHYLAPNVSFVQLQTTLQTHRVHRWLISVWLTYLPMHPLTYRDRALYRQCHFPSFHFFQKQHRKILLGCHHEARVLDTSRGHEDPASSLQANYSLWCRCQRTCWVVASLHLCSSHGCGVRVHSSSPCTTLLAIWLPCLYGRPSMLLILYGTSKMDWLHHSRPPSELLIKVFVKQLGQLLHFLLGLANMWSKPIYHPF